MHSDLALSLQITAMGMGVVFGCILLFWGMMSLLVRLARDRAPEASLPAEGQSPEREAESDRRERQAAVAAVAVALARRRRERFRPQRPAGAATLSPWQAAHRRARPRGRGTVE